MQDFFLFIQNHWILSTAFVVVVVLLVILEFIKLRSSASQLSPLQATQLINHQNAVVIDIRAHDVFSAGHIIGAHSIPANELTKNKKIEKFKSQPLIIVCNTGQESARIAETLNQQGYNAKVLANGIRSWREADMPLIKG